MNSIRRQLLILTLTATTLGSALIAVVAYLHAREELNELYDGHLKQLAITLANQGEALHFHPQDLSAPVHPGRAIRLNREENYLIQLWTPQGGLYYTSQPALPLPLQKGSGFSRLQWLGRDWRVYRIHKADFHVQVAQPDDTRSGFVTETALKITLPLVLLIPVLALLAALAVRRGLLPLNTLSGAIKQRHAAALAPLSAAQTPTELQPLVQALNDLLQQLRRTLEQQRHFIADAAHELRTPLAALQLQLDLLKRAQTEAERTQAITDLDAGIGRATHLVSQLLVTVRSEQPEPTAVAGGEPVTNLQCLAADVVEQLLPLARARHIDLGVTRLEPARVRAMDADLRAILSNLVDNAIRYTDSGGRVDVAVYSDNGAVAEITDTGAGIPAAERKRVFDRFYRIPGTRAEGSGLGLAIVKANCERCGARLAIADNPAHPHGTRFTVHFPQVAA